MRDVCKQYNRVCFTGVSFFCVSGSFCFCGGFDAGVCDAEVAADGVVEGFHDFGAVFEHPGWGF